MCRVKSNLIFMCLLYRQILQIKTLFKVLLDSFLELKISISINNNKKDYFSLFLFCEFVFKAFFC